MTRTRILRIAMILFIAITVIAFFIETFFIRQSKVQTLHAIDARFFPRVIIGLLAVSGTVCGISDWGRSDTDGEWSNSHALLLSIGIMFLCVWLLDILGFVFCGALFMVSEISVVGGKKPSVTSLLVSSICSIVFSVVFRYGFNIGIPMLPFGLL